MSSENTIFDIIESIDDIEINLSNICEEIKFVREKLSTFSEDNGGDE